MLDLSQTRSWSCSLRPVQVEILSSLNHQNIVQFLGVTVMKPDSYLVAGAPHYAYYCCKEIQLLELSCLSKVVFLLVAKMQARSRLA